MLKTNASVEDEDKMLYSHHTRGRGRGRANQNFNRGRGRGYVSNRFEGREQTNQLNWRGQGRGRSRGGRTNSGRGGRIKDVYYVLDMKNNILSLGQLLEKRYSILMEGKVMILKDKNGRTIAHIEMSQNRMFKLNLKNIQETCMQVKMEDKATLWQKRTIWL